MCKTYITQVKDLRLQIEDVEARTIARIRQPVDKEPLKDCSRKTAEQKVYSLYIFYKPQCILPLYIFIFYFLHFIFLKCLRHGIILGMT